MASPSNRESRAGIGKWMLRNGDGFSGGRQEQLWSLPLGGVDGSRLPHQLGQSSGAAQPCPKDPHLFPTHNLFQRESLHLNILGTGTEVSRNHPPFPQFHLHLQFNEPKLLGASGSHLFTRLKQNTNLAGSNFLTKRASANCEHITFPLQAITLLTEKGFDGPESAQKALRLS